MKTKFTTILYALLFILGVSVTSCSDDNSTTIQKEDAKMRFSLKVPTNSVENGEGKENEALDLNKFHVLLFENNTFYLDCEVKKEDITGLKQITSDKEYEVKIVIPRNNKVVDMVVIANVDKALFNLTEGKTTKEEFYKNTIINIQPGHWKPETLPMWAEMNTLQLTEDLGTRFDDPLLVRLVRSVSRIDLSFEENSSFDIKEAYIYNTLANYTIAPELENYTHNANKTIIKAPSTPVNTIYNGNDKITQPSEASELIDNPIKIDISKDRKSNLLAYVPEQINSTATKYKPYVVLGITDKKNNSNPNNITYYKAYLNVNKEGVSTPENLLRNHKLILLIKNVYGDGEATPKGAAVKEEAALIDIDVIPWNDNINQGYVSGSKYFGIQVTNIDFDKSTAGSEQTFAIQTNIDDLKNELKIKWEDSEHAAYFDYKIEEKGTSKKITVSVIKDNTNNYIVKNKLVISAVGNEFLIDVTLTTSNPTYQLIQDKVRPIGVFNPNEKQDLLKDNVLQVMVQIKASEFDEQAGKVVSIKTDTQEGMYFEGSETIKKATTNKSIDNITNDGLYYKDGDSYYRLMELKAKGTPLTRKKKEYMIIDNSTQKSFCKAYVQMAFRPKRIAACGSDATYGWGADAGVSRKSILYANNYGMNKNSVVKIPPFMEKKEYDKLSASEKSKYSVYTSLTKGELAHTYEEIEEMLNNCDVFIYGAFLRLDKKNRAGNRTIGDLFAEFLVEKNGVVIAMDEVIQSVQALFEPLYKKINPSQIIALKSQSAGSAGTVYPIISQPGDEILDGIFGKTSGTFWGEDATVTKTILGLPEEDLVVYSRSAFANQEHTINNKGLTMFRHTKVNLFFSGDGGFVSQNGISSGTGACPFWVKDYLKGDFTPTYRKNYGPASNYTVSNAVVFSNALAWALEKAEFEGKFPE